MRERRLDDYADFEMGDHLELDLPGGKTIHLRLAEKGGERVLEISQAVSTDGYYMAEVWVPV